MKKLRKLLNILMLLLIATTIFSACDNSSDNNKDENDNSVSDDKVALEIIYSKGDSQKSVTKNVILLTTGNNETIISWETDNEKVITTSGKVTRPSYGSGNISVVLTATIIKGLESDTKEFTLTIIEEEQTDEQAIAEDKEALKVIFSKGDSAESVKKNLILLTKGDSGTTINWASDNEKVISSTGKVSRPTYGIGNIDVVLTAKISKNKISETKEFNLTVTEEKNPDEDAVAKDKEVLEVIYSKGDSAENVKKKLTLQVEGDTGTKIDWKSDNEKVINNVGEVSRPSYGIGDIDVVLTATIKKGGVIDTKEFYLTVLEEDKTDEDAVAIDKESLEIIFSKGDSAERVKKKITLKTEGDNETSISWKSDNEKVISTTGKVSRPTYGIGNIDVLLTATIKKDEVAETKEFKLTVIEEDITDEQAVAEDKEALEIIYSFNENALSVKNNIELSMQGENGSFITWNSDNVKVIQPNGEVTRPIKGTGDVKVILNATIAKGVVSDSKEFVLNVLEAPIIFDTKLFSMKVMQDMFYGFRGYHNSLRHYGNNVFGPLLSKKDCIVNSVTVKELSLSNIETVIDKFIYSKEGRLNQVQYFKKVNDLPSVVEKQVIWDPSETMVQYFGVNMNSNSSFRASNTFTYKYNENNLLERVYNWVDPSCEFLFSRTYLGYTFSETEKIIELTWYRGLSKDIRKETIDAFYENFEEDEIFKIFAEKSDRTIHIRKEKLIYNSENILVEKRTIEDIYIHQYPQLNFEKIQPEEIYKYKYNNKGDLVVVTLNDEIWSTIEYEYDQYNNWISKKVKNAKDVVVEYMVREFKYSIK